MSARDLDFLLINRSNYPTNPIFPYAFVQVSALARRAQLSVERFECFGRTEAHVKPDLGRIVADRRPRLIGITLRQCDSMLLGEYWTPLVAEDREKRGYFPLEDTVDLVRFLRSITDAKIIVGGFGFSIHAERLMRVLRPDFGVAGEPDGMFQAFEDLLAERRLDQIPNLLYWEGTQVRTGPHRLFDSPDHTEYTQDLVTELKSFYGRDISQQTIAVELARGCPYRCFFCVEPVIKGKAVRRRPLEVVIEDLEFLIRHDLTSFWLVCSELNMGNADMAMEVAEALTRLRERHPTRPLTWRAYYLPKWLSTEHLSVLARSGFDGGWNDFPSLDDANLRACAVPYRAAHAIEALTREVENAEQKGTPVRGSMFFGNAHMNPAGVATTLKAFSDAGLCHRYDSFYPITSTRLFEVPAMSAFRSTEDVTFRRSGRSETADIAHPTFHWSEALVQQLGSVLDVEEFFVWMARAFLLKDAARFFTVLDFMRAHVAPDVVSTFLQEDPLPSVDVSELALAERAYVSGALDGLQGAAARQTVEHLYTTGSGSAAVAVAELLFRHMVAHVDRAMVWDAIGAPQEESAYVLQSRLLARFPSWDELDAHLAERVGGRAGRHSPAWIYCRGQLFQKGIRLRPAYVNMIVP